MYMEICPNDGCFVKENFVTTVNKIYSKFYLQTNYPLANKENLTTTQSQKYMLIQF